MILKVPVYIEVDVKYQEFNAEIVKFLSKDFTKKLQSHLVTKTTKWMIPKGVIPTPVSEPIFFTPLQYTEVIEVMRKGK